MKQISTTCFLQLISKMQALHIAPSWDSNSTVKGKKHCHYTKSLLHFLRPITYLKKLFSIFSLDCWSVIGIVCLCITSSSGLKLDPGFELELMALTFFFWKNKSFIKQYSARINDLIEYANKSLCWGQINKSGEYSQLQSLSTPYFCSKILLNILIIFHY